MKVARNIPISLKNTKNIYFQIKIVFFLRGVMKTSEQTSRTKAYSTVSKKSQLKTQLLKKNYKKNKKNYKKFKHTRINFSLPFLMVETASTEKKNCTKIQRLELKFKKREKLNNIWQTDYFNKSYKSNNDYQTFKIDQSSKQKFTTDKLRQL